MSLIKPENINLTLPSCVGVGCVCGRALWSRGVPNRNTRPTFAMYLLFERTPSDDAIEAQGWVVYIGGKCLDRWGNQREWPEVGWLHPTIEEARNARDRWGASWGRRIVRVTRTRRQVPFSAAFKRGSS